MQGFPIEICENRFNCGLVPMVYGFFESIVVTVESHEVGGLSRGLAWALEVGLGREACRCLMVGKHVPDVAPLWRVVG